MKDLECGFVDLHANMRALADSAAVEGMARASIDYACQLISLAGWLVFTWITSNV